MGRSGKPTATTQWSSDPYEPEPPEPFQVESGDGTALAERPEPRPQPVSEEMSGTVALITGGSTGIGRATAFAFAEQGVHIAFNFLDDGAHTRRQARNLAAQLRQIGVLAWCDACNVRDPVQAKHFVERTLAEMGDIHFLVNNAGIGRDGALWRMSDAEWKAVMETNLDGAFYFTREVAKHMRELERGKIVNVASVHGLRSEFGLSNYSASKAGMIGLTHASALELGPSNINVNAVAPGYIRTTRLTESVPPEILDRARERSALGRLGDPRDVAEVILFLCSEAARHVTGAVLPVDGGYVL